MVTVVDGNGILTVGGPGIVSWMSVGYYQNLSHRENWFFIQTQVTK